MIILLICGVNLDPLMLRYKPHSRWNTVELILKLFLAIYQSNQNILARCYDLCKAHWTFHKTLQLTKLSVIRLQQQIVLNHISPCINGSLSGSTSFGLGLNFSLSLNPIISSNFCSSLPRQPDGHNKAVQPWPNFVQLLGPPSQHQSLKSSHGP